MELSYITTMAVNCVNDKNSGKGRKSVTRGNKMK
jgi:hypothetical protein